MAATADEKRAYGRGYNAGMRGGWPLYARPVAPETGPVRVLADAALLLAGCVDHNFATLLEEDREEDFCGMESARIAVIGALANLRAWGLVVVAQESDEKQEQGGSRE